MVQEAMGKLEKQNSRKESKVWHMNGITVLVKSLPLYKLDCLQKK